MDTMEDSGFDSDQQRNNGERTNGIAQNASFKLLSQHSPTEIRPETSTATARGSMAKNSASKSSSQIQKKIARQREAVRISQPGDSLSRRALLSRNRLPVPTREDAVISTSDMQPLVMIDTDESEDEFTMPPLSLKANKEITQQLIKDGYNLDLEPDDEDLDLIPPRPLKERYVCCPGSHLWSSSCTVQ